MYLGNIAGLIVVLTTVPLFASILRIPFSIIAPVIIAICAIGAFTVHNALLDVTFMLMFGIIGYAFTKLEYPMAPLVPALVLGDMAESHFRNADRTSVEKGQSVSVSLDIGGRSVCQTHKTKISNLRNTNDR